MVHSWRVVAGMAALLWLTTQIGRADEGSSLSFDGNSSDTETTDPTDLGSIVPASSIFSDAATNVADTEANVEQDSDSVIPTSGLFTSNVTESPLVADPNSAPGSRERLFRPLMSGRDQPKWDVRVGAIFLERSSPQPGQIIHPVSSSATVSNGSDFSFPSASATPDITAFRRFRWGGGVQVRYFGGTEWTSGVNYGVVGNVQIGSFPNFGATGLTSTYTSQLNNNFEVNWVRPLGERISFIAGFRELQVNEYLNYHVTFPAFTANYNWNEANQLRGGQFGCMANLWRLNSRLSVIATFKGGVYMNTASNSFNLLPSTGGSFPGGASGTQTAYVGELGANASFRITRHLSLYGGYQVMWVDGLALSVNQAANATANHTQNGITTNGDLFYFGTTTGLRVTW